MLFRYKELKTNDDDVGELADLTIANRDDAKKGFDQKAKALLGFLIEACRAGDVPER